MIRAALVEFLKNDPDLNALVHSRIFPYVPEGGGYPRLTIARSGNREWSSLAGSSGTSVSNIDIVSWSNVSRDQALEVAELVKNSRGGRATNRKLKEFAGNMTGDGLTYKVQCCRIGEEEDDELSPTDGSETMIHIIRQPYTITWNEP